MPEGRPEFRSADRLSAIAYAVPASLCGGEAGTEDSVFEVKTQRTDLASNKVVSQIHMYALSIVCSQTFIYRKQYTHAHTYTHTIPIYTLQISLSLSLSLFHTFITYTHTHTTHTHIYVYVCIYIHLWQEKNIFKKCTVSNLSWL